MKTVDAFKNKEEFLDCYQHTASGYDKARSLDFEGRRVDYLQIKLLSRLLQKHRCKKILEAGCGTGRIMIPLALKGYECYGFDASQNMLQQLKAKMHGTKALITLKTGDIENIPHKDNTFDCTYTVHVLMHMQDYKKAFKEMYRVTKPSGIVICDFPNKNSLWTKLSVFLNPTKKRTKLYSVDELVPFFKQYDSQIGGLFSYARTFYQIPILRHVARFLDDHAPLPIRWRTQLFLIVKKQ